MPEPLEQITSFKEGLVSKDTISTMMLDESAALDILNVEYHPRGSISKREGFRSYTMSSGGSNPLSGIMKIYPWIDASNTDQTLVYTTSSSGNLSADLYAVALSGTPSSNVLTAQKCLSAHKYAADQWSPNISADEIHIASYAGSAIAVAGGEGPPLVFSGAGSAMPAATWQYSGAKHIEAWGNYLFMGNFIDTGIRNRSRLQWNLGAGSVWDGVTSWPASYYIDVDADDGDEITGLKLLREYLCVFKRSKIFLVWYTGDANIFTFRRQVSDVGCIAGNSIVQKGEYIYFLSEKGFYRFDGESATEISTKIKHYITNHVSKSLVSVCNSEVYDLHRQVWFSVNYTPFDDATENSDALRRANAIFVYDYEMKNWTLYDIKASALANCMLNQTTKKADLVIGHTIQTDNDRKACLSKFGDEETSDIYNTAITSYWVSRWLDLKDPSRNKRLLRTVIYADQEGTETDSYELTWEMREDYKDTAFSGVLAAMSGTVYLTGSTTTLSGETIQSNRTGLPMELRLDMSRTLRTWQLKLSNDQAGQPWTVHKITFEGVQKGQTKVT